jgi:hypothetical protein
LGHLFSEFTHRHELNLFLSDDCSAAAIRFMARTDQPAFLASSAFWNFVADQQADPVVRRLHEQVGTVLQRQPVARADRGPAFRSA